MHRIAALVLALVGAATLTAEAVGRGNEEQARERMVRTIEAHAAAIGAERRRIAPRVLSAMRAVPRHQFVPEALRGRAYEDRPLPIGNSQTISQPFIVALMTDLIAPDRNDVVLEVGTGSGYQAAVLSRLVRRVYTIEIVEPLADQAARRLAALGYRNVTVRHGDGYAGWPEHAPFDAVMVTAGADHIPQPLVRQLKSGGKLVIPVGRSSGGQELILLEKHRDGRLLRKRILPVAFVPLTGRVQD